MQEQNFEKQVRSKMDELSFVPSAPVWDKVEEQIRKKKEKRRIIFWLLPVFVIGGLGLWLMNEKGNPNEKTEIASHQNKSNRTPDNNQVYNKNSNEPHTSTIDPLNQNNSTKRQNINSEPKQNQVSTTTNFSLKNSVSKDKQIQISSFEKRKGYTKRKKNSSTIPAFPVSDDQPLSVNQNTFEIVDQTTTLPLLNALNKDSSFAIEVLSNLNIPHINNPAKSLDNTLPSKKWELAFTAQGGISGISNGISLFAKSADMMYFDSSPAPANVSTGGFSNIVVPRNPSIPKSSIAYSAGLDIRRKINNRFIVFSGLRYAFYSNTLEVGSSVKRDTSFARADASLLRTQSYYSNDVSLHKYTNQYHYIQVPVGLEYQVFKSLPLSIQGGIKLERLLYSNALFYNKYAGVYVKDKEMLAKTGVHVFSGINYHFRKDKAFSFSLGPQIQYGMSKLTKKNSSTQRLYFIGLSTQFLIKK